MSVSQRPPAVRGAARRFTGCRRFRPGIEGLEARTTPTIVFVPHFGVESTSGHGGGVFSNAQVYAVFWGSYWNSASGNLAPTSVTAGLSNILSGPFLSGLTQYGSNGVATYKQSVVVQASSPANGFATSDLEGMLDTVIGNSLPAPSAGGNASIYAVFTPPGISDPNGDGGYNTSYYWQPQSGSGAPTLAYVVWVSVPSDPRFDAYGSLTSIFSHEMADLTAGVTVTPSPSWPFNPENQGQVSDYEGPAYKHSVNGQTVQSYWSQQDWAYIIPDGSSQNTYQVPVWDNTNDFTGNYITANEYVAADGGQQLYVLLDDGTLYGQLNAGAWNQIGTNVASFTVAPDGTLSVVHRETPVFDSLTAPTVVYGTSTATISGHIAAGADIPPGDVTITEFGATISAAIDPSTGDFSATIPTDVAVGSTPYALSLAYAGTPFFDAATAATTLAVVPAPLTIKADDKAMIRGQTLPVLTASYTGLASWDASSRRYPPVHLATTAVRGSPAGVYPITASGAVDSNYVISYLPGNLTVTTAVPDDYNGDGTTDLTLFSAAAATWYVAGLGSSRVSGSQAAVDIPAPGNYDGTGKAEMADFRSTTGQWFITGHARPTQQGGKGDLPVPGDYYGTGRDIPAVFRPSNGQWLLSGSTKGIVVVKPQPGDIPVPGDYNGDGKMDEAIYRPSTLQWFIDVGGNVQTVKYGAPGAVPVPGDYYGTGKTVEAVFVPSTGQWYVGGSARPVVVTPPRAGDMAVPGVYDGRGIVEEAIYRPSTGTWYIDNGGQVRTVKFGGGSLSPAIEPYAYRLAGGKVIVRAIAAGFDGSVSHKGKGK